MALQKIIQTTYGVSTKYHRIDKIQISYKAKLCVFEIHSYLSKEARDDGNKPLSITRCGFGEKENPQNEWEKFGIAFEDNLTNKLYSKLKLTPEWEESTDC